MITPKVTGFPYDVPITQIKNVPHPDTVRVDFHIKHHTTWYPERGAGGRGVLCYDNKNQRRGHIVDAFTWRDAIDLAIQLESA